MTWTKDNDTKDKWQSKSNSFVRLLLLALLHCLIADHTNQWYFVAIPLCYFITFLIKSALFLQYCCTRLLSGEQIRHWVTKKVTLSFLCALSLSLGWSYRMVNTRHSCPQLCILGLKWLRLGERTILCALLCFHYWSPGASNSFIVLCGLFCGWDDATTPRYLCSRVHESMQSNAVMYKNQYHYSMFFFF